MFIFFMNDYDNSEKCTCKASTWKIFFVIFKHKFYVIHNDQCEFHMFNMWIKKGGESLFRARQNYNKRKIGKSHWFLTTKKKNAKLKDERTCEKLFESQNNSFERLFLRFVWDICTLI